MRTEKNRIALAGASRAAEKAIQAASAPELAQIPDDEKSAWAMAAIIHCDVVRLFVALEECEREGIARLLWLGNIASQLYEAAKWYDSEGMAAIRKIAERKPLGIAHVNEKVIALRKNHRIHRVRKYANYRNKLGYHYGASAISHLKNLGSEDAGEFFNLLTSFVKFSGDWARLTKDLLQSR